MSAYRNDQPHTLTAALVRDGTDALLKQPEHRGQGHGAARERAIGEVLAGLLSVETDREAGR